ncbi:MAG: protein kinase [Gemmatimonadetes bacterium]|nr:protein kinase [Gemmatimonadota bacterium]
MARFPIIVALLALASVRASAQCPDGTAPPCQRVATSQLTRRAEPRALGERAWVVVPFANVAKAQEIDWLRDASVNLLSLDLSRWSDIVVVDDKHVGDLLRELPPARLAGLTLSDGLGIARRAGAATLVMGDFVKVGRTIRIIANVFDTKTGTRIRTVQQSTDADSLLGAFGPLARSVLSVPPPADAKLGAVGTSRVDAYREYLLGESALNRFELTNAKQHLSKALTLDSTFALAHFKLALAIHWDGASDDTTERTHALSAARLGGSLPPRERALISARVALANGETERSCAAVRGLAAKDSSDVEALYAIGECEYHGGRILERIDSSHARLRGNWNVAIAAFRRVLWLDPTYHPAFEHILDALTRDRFIVCASAEFSCGNDPNSWLVIALRDADSLLIVPLRSRSAELSAAQIRSERERAPLLNKRAAQRIAEEWVTAGPSEARAHLDLASVDLALGEIDRASDELQTIGAAVDENTRLASLTSRVHIAIIRGRGAEAHAVFDTLVRLSAKTIDYGGPNAMLSATFGHFAPVTAALRRLGEEGRWSPAKLQYWMDQPRVMLGVPSDSAGAHEHRYWSSLTADTACAAGAPRCRTTALLPSLAYGLRMHRDWWPPFPVTAAGFRFGPAEAIVRQRRDLLSSAVVGLEQITRSRINAGAIDQATGVIAADAALAANDTVAARRNTRFFVDSVAPMAVWISAGAPLGGSETLQSRWLLLPRMMLLRAELADAARDMDEAREWYAKVLSLWSDADPELQPTVSRIRAALARAGGTP